LEDDGSRLAHVERCWWSTGHFSAEGARELWSTGHLSAMTATGFVALFAKEYERAGAHPLAPDSHPVGVVQCPPLLLFLLLELKVRP